MIVNMESEIEDRSEEEQPLTKEVKKWQLEKERYDEIIEYIKEVDEILDLIKPFPRDIPQPKLELARVNSADRVNHLENILKLVEQLKELQENNSKYTERMCCMKDLKKLREHKRRLKNEEQELRDRGRARSTTSPENLNCISKNRKISSTSEKLEDEAEGWQHKRKSLCLTEGQKSKVSKWTKVKEAFHWERTSTGKTKKELHLDLPLENDVWDASPDDESTLDGFPLPPPPPVPPRSPRSEDFLSVPDFPSSSSSDRLDDLFLEVKGAKASDGDSGNQNLTLEDVEDDLGRKSLVEEFPQNLSKEISGKSNKTTWGKVKDIIQTRKDSLKKKPKKRGSDEFKKRRKLSTLSTSPDQFEDLPSPEDKLKTPDAIPRTSYEFPEELQLGEEKCSKKLMPALTVTLPSTEELRSLTREDLEKRDVEEDEKILGQFSCQAQYYEDKPKFAKSKGGQNQRLSRWIKVKRVFLTSGTPMRPVNYSPVNDSSPTSLNKSSGFFSDLESDEVSSGEWIDDKSPSQEKLRIDIDAGLQEETRKSYIELKKELTQEFDHKMREWELKESGKLEEVKDDVIPKARKTRDSMAVPLPSLNDLSPEFKKKLNDWKKMKTSQSSSSVSSSATKEEIQGQNIKIKIGEWQPWRSRGSQKNRDQEEFKKSDEQKLRSRPPSNRRKDKDDGSARREAKRDSTKKSGHSRTPSGAESMGNDSLSEKDGRFNRRTQKDFQWVEKELQKIEKEKIRLEQEKEKYLEREARLEKMKKTIGTTCPTQEILVRTPAGFFRFKGISQKFTKKLYEWEKAKGIAPEASTFALLEQSARTSNGVTECVLGIPLQRSKSTGSIPELPSSLLIQKMTHHPSSLSLNDVDEFKNRETNALELPERVKSGSEEPEAIIVDVEDIEEETALLADPPSAKGEVPVYAYATPDIEKAFNSTERYYFSTEDIKVIETINLRHDTGVFKELQETETTYGQSNQTNQVEVQEQTDFQQPSEVWMIKDVKSSLDSETNSKQTDDLPQILETHASRELHEITKKETSSERDMISSGLIKSPKTFFEWTNSESSNVSMVEETSESWKNRTRTDKISNEVLKKKLKEKITLMQRMSVEGKSWMLPEYRLKDAVLNPQQVNEVSYVRSSTSLNVIVPTTRKIISPVKTTQGTTPLVCSYVIDDVKLEDNQEKCVKSQPSRNFMPKINKGEKIHDIGMPPLPNSPKFYKKINKEAAPSIRTMINKFNQKISEHETANERRCDSGSPRLWHSPVFGRRTQEWIDRYSKNGEVQKSASLDNMRSIPKVSTPPLEESIKGILKSSSVGVMKIRQNPDLIKENSPSTIRAMKIQKAKEEFLSGRLESWSGSTTSSVPSEPTTPQIEITGDFPSISKSVSAETITNEKPEPSENVQKEGRPIQKSSSKFDISSIKSKFRKIRMRKEKDLKLNAVAALCRQSLFIEVPKTDTQASTSMSKSCPSSPVMDRNKNEKNRNCKKK